MKKSFWVVVAVVIGVMVVVVVVVVVIRGWPLDAIVCAGLPAIPAVWRC